MEPIIKVDNVSMCFNLSTEKHESLKEYLLAMVQGRLQYDEFYALRDVSLDIMPGDFYGLVGLNGSGKSTLLKTIAGVLKNYSSGMVARIGFAIATITKPDILIADEVLAVGDFLFQQKCEKRMKELMAGGTTVILVSHSIEQIERMCSKVAWLSHGHLKMNGDTETVCNAYKAVQRGEA